MACCSECGRTLFPHEYAQHADGRPALECQRHGLRDSLTTVYSKVERERMAAALSEGDA
jgi:hypothetical protein